MRPGGRKDLFKHLNAIPVITNPLGKYWKQPEVEQIELDDTHALMSKEIFDELLEYSCSQPTGVYEGKMWKSKTIDGWILRWFAEDPRDNENYCSNNSRLILTV